MGPFFSIFLVDPMILFFAVNASLHWLNNVSGMYLVQVYLILVGQHALASYWLDDCANCTPMPEENDKYGANNS
jgi:hypothetical protein